MSIIIADIIYVVNDLHIYFDCSELNNVKEK